MVHAAETGAHRHFAPRSLSCGCSCRSSAPQAHGHTHPPTIEAPDAGQHEGRRIKHEQRSLRALDDRMQAVQVVIFVGTIVLQAYCRHREATNVAGHACCG